MQRRTLNKNFIINLLYGKIDAIRLLNRAAPFYVPKLGSRHNQIFEISTPKTNYIRNDPIQKTMCLTNFNISLFGHLSLVIFL